MLETKTIEYIMAKAAKSKRKMYEIAEDIEIPLIRACWSKKAKVILTSDLHHNAMSVLPELVSRLDDPKEWIFVSAGDMAGSGVKGSDGDSSEALQYAQGVFKKVFFVHGNHDLEVPFLSTMRNDDGSYCHLHDRVQDIPEIGKIGGVDGIISSKKKLQRLPLKEYLRVLDKVTRQSLDLLVTHEVPKITDGKVGREEILTPVLDSRTGYHLFGHHHFREGWCFPIRKTCFLNVDSRVLLLSSE